MQVHECYYENRLIGWSNIRASETSAQVSLSILHLILCIHALGLRARENIQTSAESEDANMKVRKVTRLECGILACPNSPLVPSANFEREPAEVWILIFRVPCSPYTPVHLLGILNKTKKLVII